MAIFCVFASLLSDGLSVLGGRCERKADHVCCERCYRLESNAQPSETVGKESLLLLRLL